MTKFLEWVAVLIACLGMAIVASGCAHSGRTGCVSECGMLFDSKPNGSMSCEVLQEAEDKTLDAFDRMKSLDPRFERDSACKALFGWQIVTFQEAIGRDKDINGGGPYLGASLCGPKEMRLQANFNWQRGSYVHEIAHVIQSCNAPQSWKKFKSPTFAGDGHEGWEENGLYHLIDLVRDGKL